MTAIVGIQGDGWSVLAADTMTEYSNKPFVADGMIKLIERGDYIFAFAGDGIAGDLANFMWIPPKLIKTMDLDKFVMTKVLPSLKACFMANGYNASKEAEKDDGGFDALLSVNGTIYQITSDFGWMRSSTGLYGVGSGGDLALGALSAFKRNKTPEGCTRQAMKAIEIAATYNIYVGGDITVMTQEEF